MEKRILKIQEHLRKFNLEATVDKFRLKIKSYEHKTLFKYDQLIPPTMMALPEIQECRGLILENGTWNVLSMAFEKFFNNAETHAAKIDWDNSHILNKEDGTMIQVYWDWHKEVWYAGTTGTANGEGEVNNKMGTTFNSLFWSTVKDKYGLEPNKLTKGYTYVWELTTPYNIVVKPHGESSATLLTIRNLETLKEIPRKELLKIGNDLGVPVVVEYSLNIKNAGALIKTFENMPWSEEGYVVVDSNFNRVKIKNPAYLSVHHLKGKSAEHNILTIVKTNEIEEFASTFPERKEELYRLKTNYDLLVNKLTDVWLELELLKPKNITSGEKKRYAMEVFKKVDVNNIKSFSGLYFGLAEGKITSVEDFMFNYDNKILYKLL